MNKQTTEFNIKFQHFEKILKMVTNSSDETNFNSALKKASDRNIYINDNFHLIEDLYALRNVFSHRERGQYVAEISDFALKEIDRLIEALNNPPTVISKFKTQVYQVQVTKSIPAVMEVMRTKTYTHVPIWDDTNFIGVFSYSSFFEWLAERQIKENQEVTFTKKFMGDINRKYLNSPSVNFEFIPETKNTYEITPIFQKATLDQKRLDCLFITPNGSKGEEITGIITSWDLGGIK